MPQTFQQQPAPAARKYISATGKESQHNISGLSSFFENLQSVMSYQQTDTSQPVSPAEHATTSRLSSNHHHRTARTSAATSPASSTISRRQPAAAVEPLHLPPISLFQDHCCQTFKGPFQDHPNLSKTINSCCLKKIPKMKH